MKKLIIIGARGFGREVYDLFLKCKHTLGDIECIGYLDDNPDVMVGYQNYPPIISSAEKYKPTDGDVFICALGDPHAKKKYSEIILKKGGEFISIIHPLSQLGTNSQIGKGCIITEFSSISSDAKLGDFVTVMSHSVIGHDCKIGNWSHLGAHSFFGGFSQIGSLTTIHPGGKILPHKKVGNNVCVGAGSVVIRNIKDDMSVFGVPAVKLKF